MLLALAATEEFFFFRKIFSRRGVGVEESHTCTCMEIIENYSEIEMNAIVLLSVDVLRAAVSVVVHYCGRRRAQCARSTLLLLLLLLRLLFAEGEGTQLLPPARLG